MVWGVKGVMLLLFQMRSISGFRQGGQNALSVAAAVHGGAQPHMDGRGGAVPEIIGAALKQVDNIRPVRNGQGDGMVGFPPQIFQIWEGDVQNLPPVPPAAAQLKKAHAQAVFAVVRLPEDIFFGNERV